MHATVSDIDTTRTHIYWIELSDYYQCRYVSVVFVSLCPCYIDEYYVRNFINISLMFQPGYLGKLLPDSAPNYPEPLQHVLNGLITLLTFLN
jgi:hypothetical protein